MFDLLFLGTGASIPSRDSALPCVAVRRGSDIILFDCGEGSQRQLMCSRMSFMKIRGIFITHLHGDHFFGLPGLLQTMGMSGRTDPLIVCGPAGFSEALKMSLSVCEGEIEYPLEIRDVNPGDTVQVRDLTVSVFKTEHGIVSQGYVLREPDTRGPIDGKKAKALGLEGRDFTELENGGTVNGVRLEDICSSTIPGRSVAYTGDTMKCQTIADAVKGVDILIHEATYAENESENAEKHFHSTAASAAQTAKDAGVKALMLIHISNRYKDRSVILEEAKAVFPDTFVPSDFDFYTMTKNGVRLA
ncbi:MAG: ribonuclease Z [Candidatus Methanomethylophilus sp.]|nr:ribonuclease Z [Methanomethylophilus sp.]